MPNEAEVAEAPKRGRPRTPPALSPEEAAAFEEWKRQRAQSAQNTAPSTVVLTPEEAARQEWQEFQAKATKYADEQMPAPCPKCGARAGYNEVTGIQVRSHIGKTVIDGHRDSCPENTVNKKGK